MLITSHAEFTFNSFRHIYLFYLNNNFTLNIPQGEVVHLPINVIFYDADLPENNQYRLHFPNNQPLM